MISSGEASHLQVNLNYNLSVDNKKQSIIWRCEIISRIRRALSLWRRMDFPARWCCYPQCINNKVVLNWTKIRLFSHLACSSDFNTIEHLWGLIVGKVYEGSRQYSAISKLKTTISDAWEKYLRFNFRNQLIACLVELLRLSKLTADQQNIE